MQKHTLLLVFSILCLITIPSVKAQEKFIDIPLSEDTYVEEGFPTVSPWNNRNLYLGNDTWYSKKRTRIFIKPDVRLLVNAEVLTSDIVDAQLILTAYELEGVSVQTPITISPAAGIWNMYSLTWANQPSHIPSIIDSSSVLLKTGTIFFPAKKTMLFLLDNYPNNVGLILQYEQETRPALISWATGCELAPTLPRCVNSSETPKIRVYYNENTLPTSCNLALPSQDGITNQKELSLRALPSIDAEKNTISYLGRVCQDETCTKVVWQGAISLLETEKVPVPLDGTYIVQCSAKDYHYDTPWGAIRSVTVDTNPPLKPILINEPAFTGTMSNELFWYPSSTEDTIEYRVLASERPTFSAYNTYSDWTKANTISFTHAKEKTFYYKLQARDEAGNISEWSDSTSTTIDTTVPVFTYTKTTKYIVSHSKMLDYWVDGAAYLQVGIEEENSKTIICTIRDHAGTVVYREQKEDSTYLWTHWPEKTTYPNGVYMFQCTATDEILHYIQSDPILITLDKTPPPLAHISGIQEGKTYNRKQLPATITCRDSVSAKAYLGNEKLHAGSPKATVVLQGENGDRIFRATCTDIAGNTSEARIHFFIDTNPPSTPSITITYTSVNKQIVASVYCREAGIVHYFQNGVAVSSIPCTQGKYATTIVESNPTLPYLVHVQASQEDMVGNRSNLGTKSLFIEVQEKKDTAIHPITCTVSYNHSTQTFGKFACTWPAQFLLKYLKTEPTKDLPFRSLFAVTKLKETTVTLYLKRCKPKTFFDVRTWFGCFEELLEERTLSASTTPLFSAPKGIENLNEHTVSTPHGKEEKISITQSYFSFISFALHDQFKSYGTTSPPLTEFFTPQYPNTASKNAYFAWLFSGPRTVSQWHGYTAFQSPHKGIDFSVNKDIVLVPAPGTIVSARYDKTDSCNAGGNYVAIKHDNGLFTYYFHLATLTTPEGKPLKTGTRVSTGQKLAVTGNSGMYNCQALGYHLHFETRTSQLPKDHINPIPYFAVDWSTIKTARADQYPGRLKGDNPHPFY